MKKITIIPVAVSVKRADLLSIRQDHGENVRFFSRVSGKAATCNYSMKCSNSLCNNHVDFTNVIIKDVLISGLSDDDIKKDVLGCPNQDQRTVQETISFIESKEMARDALTKPLVSASVSSYKSKSKSNIRNTDKTTCNLCKIEIDTLRGLNFAWIKFCGFRGF